MSEPCRTAGPLSDDDDFRALPEGSAQGVFCLDGAGRLDFVDTRAAEILGYAPEEIAGLAFEGFLVEEMRPRAHASFDQRRRGYGGISEYRMLHRSGAPLWIAVASVPRFDDHGAFLGVTGFVTDIDGQRRRQELSTHKLRLLRQIAANQPLAIVLDDLCLTLEAVLRRPSHAAIMLAKQAYLGCIAAPSLPARFREERKAVLIEGRETACARAVRSGHRILMEDTSRDDVSPQVAALRHDYGVGAVWSYPIAQDGETLGTLTLMPRAPGCPDAEDERAIEFALQVARLALANERKSEALRESEQRFRDYAELSADWYWEQDADFRFTHVSGGIASKSGFSTADILGKTRWELPVEGPSAEVWSAHRALLMRREIFRDFVYPIRTANGGVRWLSIGGKPVFGPDGEFAGYRGIGRDITDRWRAERQLRELATTLESRVKARTAALEEANRELDAFNFSVTHDLRTPLRAIAGFSQALLDDCQDRLDATGRDHLQRIVSATKRMGDLIEALYDLSRLSRSPLFLRQVNLSEMARRLSVELREREPSRIVEVDIAETPVAEGDARLLHIVLANLLDNAWKYTAKTIPACIAFGARNVDNTTVYFVRDNGAGFDMRFADKLFRMFHRLHREEEFCGYGVGLTTVQRIVVRHGGRIWAESTRGAGATFFFTLWEDDALHKDVAESADAECLE